MATYFVDMAVGDDGNLGTSEGAGNAWETVDKAMNEVAAGDKVWVKASANYTETATIDTAGTTTSPIIFEGYTSTPGDGGRATITGGAARANCIVDDLAADTSIYYVFKNLRITNATGDGFVTDCDHITFKNCKFDTNGGGGLVCQLVACEACEFSSNTDRAAYILAGGGIFIGCTFYNNTANALSCDGYPLTVLFSTFFSNAGSAIVGGGDNCITVIANCTIDGDADDTDSGVFFNNVEGLTAIINTIAYDCSTGFWNLAGDTGERVISRNNCVNANATDYNNMATFTGEVTAAPNFVNEVGGADYTPDTDSPLIDAGFDAGS